MNPKETHTKARSREGEEIRNATDSKNLRASASPCEALSSENLRAFVSSRETSPIRNLLLAVIKAERKV
jgi:hypothetical protein